MRVHWSLAGRSVMAPCSSTRHTASVYSSRSCSAESLVLVVWTCVKVCQTSDLHDDDDVHDQDADVGDDLGEEALKDHHDPPHRVVADDAALLSKAPAVLVTQLMVAITLLGGVVESLIMMITENQSFYAVNFCHWII